VQDFLNFTLTGIAVGFVYAAFALCLVLIFRATRIINFGQGAQAMFTTFIALDLIQRGVNYWLAFAAALVAGFIIGAVIERTIIRPVETGPEINAVIVTLGVFVFFVALASILFGNTLQSFPAAFSRSGLSPGGFQLTLRPLDLFNIAAVLIAMTALLVLFRFTTLGLQMRAAAFGQEVARLLGVRVGSMLTLGWALAGLFGSLAGLLVAGGELVFPGYMDFLIVFGFVAAVLGGLDSFPGAVVGGLIIGLTTTYMSAYRQPELVTLAVLVILLATLLLRPGGLFSSSVARKV
jgi:branched-chain amino acid transport system permease protein